MGGILYRAGQYFTYLHRPSTSSEQLARNNSSRLSQLARLVDISSCTPTALEGVVSLRVVLRPLRNDCSGDLDGT